MNLLKETHSSIRIKFYLSTISQYENEKVIFAAEILSSLETIFRIYYLYIL